jgi:hypothetical protein
MSTLRLALAAALLPALTACTAVVPVDVTRDLALQAPVGAFSVTQEIDLTTEAAVWSRRDSIDAVSVDEVTATVLSVGPGNQATSATIAIAFRPDGAPADGGQDLQVGTLAGLQLTAGQSVSLPGSAALDAFLLDALHGSGRFTALASGALAGQADAVIQLHLAGSAAYRVIGK